MARSVRQVEAARGGEKGRGMGGKVELGREGLEEGEKERRKEWDGRKEWSDLGREKKREVQTRRKGRKERSDITITSLLPNI